jgi:hypothetical protein
MQYRQIAAEIHARITNREAFLKGGVDAIPKLEAYGGHDDATATATADEADDVAVNA